MLGEACYRNKGASLQATRPQELQELQEVPPQSPGAEERQGTPGQTRLPQSLWDVSL